MTALHSPQERILQQQGTPAAAPRFRDNDRLLQKSPDEAEEVGQWQH